MDKNESRFFKYDLYSALMKIKTVDFNWGLILFSSMGERGEVEH